MLLSQAPIQGDWSPVECTQCPVDGASTSIRKAWSLLERAQSPFLGLAVERSQFLEEQPCCPAEGTPYLIKSAQFLCQRAWSSAEKAWSLEDGARSLVERAQSLVDRAQSLVERA